MSTQNESPRVIVTAPEKSHSLMFVVDFPDDIDAADAIAKTLTLVLEGVRVGGGGVMGPIDLDHTDYLLAAGMATVISGEAHCDPEEAAAYRIGRAVLAEGAIVDVTDRLRRRPEFDPAFTARLVIEGDLMRVGRLHDAAEAADNVAVLEYEPRTLRSAEQEVERRPAVAS